MEDGVGVAEAFFAGAEGSEVFTGFGGFVSVEFEDDSAGRFASDGHVKVAVGHFRNSLNLNFSYKVSLTKLICGINFP